LPPECVLVAVIRKGNLLIPNGDTILYAVDEVIALVHTKQVKNLAKILGPS
jgi:trk system potassium uptake protein TrkA